MRLRQQKKFLKMIDDIVCKFEYSENEDMFTKSIEYAYNAIVYIHENSKNENEIISITNEILKKLDLMDNENRYYDLFEDINILNGKIKNYENVKLEVVFLPYKTSMWDSFDSVWRAAKEDPQCNCNVVPIPYYELDSNGNPIRLCYEGNKFHEDINITAYESYNIEDLMPDIIYVHNPYDECNRLTRIDPRYYSSNLKNYTDMLVYIPYYVDGCHENSKEHSNWSKLPVVFNANRVIVQSDVQQQLFIENGYNRSKILNLGSPKFDATLNCLENKHEISEELKNIIKDKKIFLLSTGIASLLNDDNWIQDIIKIIVCFIESKSSILIWRLHPLTEVTIKAMRPDLLQGYLELKRIVSSSDCVIFDENNDVYESISISDALISDYSSIMFQYMITDRPILGLVEKKFLNGNRYYSINYLNNYFECNGMDISEFKQMVLSGEDYKRDDRRNGLNSSITNADGSCGKQVHLNIKSQILN